MRSSEKTLRGYASTHVRIHVPSPPVSDTKDVLDYSFWRDLERVSDLGRRRITKNSGGKKTIKKTQSVEFRFLLSAIWLPSKANISSRTDETMNIMILPLIFPRTFWGQEAGTDPKGGPKKNYFNFFPI